MLLKGTDALNKVAIYIDSLGVTGFARFLFGKFSGKPGTRSLRWRGNDIGLRKGTSDFSCFAQVMAYEEYKVAFPFFKNSPPRLIIDCGANIGLSALFLNDAFPDARIIALEAEDSNYQLLKENTRGKHNIQPLHKAVWPESGIVRIADTEAANWSFSVTSTDGDEPAGSTISAVSVADLLKDFPGQDIDLLKIDIEGGERELFSRNYEQWLPRTKVIVIELHDKKVAGCSTEFFKATSQYGFEYRFNSEHVIAYRRAQHS